jgi:isopentenyl-diphosphate delta-isomerase
VSRSERKWDHIRYALASEQNGSSAFDDIQFIHQSIPDVNVSDIRLDHALGGLPLSSPIFINAMTGGGDEKTYRINKELAMVANDTGIAMAVGSQMAALRDTSQRYTYEIVRKENPNGIIIANLGSEATPEYAKRAVEMIEANALQIHLNVVQELTMPEGDREFSGVLQRIEAIMKEINVPVIIKEVGFGMSIETIHTLKSMGVTIVDVGGTGGTNFAEIENKRRESSLSFFNHWGIPTAISLLEAVNVTDHPSIIASGGIRSSLDIAKSLSLGAEAVGIAGLFLGILVKKGIESLQSEIEILHNELTFIMAALGARTILELKNAPLMISGRTYHWLNQRGLDTTKYSQRQNK